jgi:HD-like signal output (HDOD) protein
MTLDRETIVSLGTKVAPSAAIYGRLCGLLDDPRTSTDDIVKLIRMDQALTFHVIRVSNSVIFGLHVQNDTLEAAVGRVGFREIYRMVGLAATQQVCQRDLVAYRLRAGRLWENSIATAAAAEVLAPTAHVEPGLAYTAGLLRTLGRVIIDNVAAGHAYPGEAEWPLVAEWEQATFGITATEVTAILLEKWHFPPEIVDAIRCHFDPFSGLETNGMGCLLNLACGVVARLGLDLPGESGHWIGSPTELRLANLPESVLEECEARARAHYAAMCATVA